MKIHILSNNNTITIEGYKNHKYGIGGSFIVESGTSIISTFTEWEGWSLLEVPTWKED